ncbi:MAG: cytochrome c family protein [Rhizobiaceae bacterium]
MDSFEINKVIGGLLATVFVVFSISLVSEALFAAPVPEKPGFIIEAAEGDAHGGDNAGGQQPAGPESIIPLLASADPTKGADIFKRCVSCHTIDKGGANKTGPNLWGIVDRPIASHEGFGYSKGMKDFVAAGNEHWDYNHLDHFLFAPKAYVKGTAMGYAGVKKTDERANLVAYMRTMADAPVPLPEAGAAPAPENASAPGEAATPPATGEAAPAEPATPAEAPAEPATPPANGEAAPAAPAEGATAPAETTPPAEGETAPAQ